MQRVRQMAYEQTLATQKNTLYLSQISKGVCISFSSDTTDKITYYRDNEETPT